MRIAVLMDVGFTDSALGSSRNFGILAPVGNSFDHGLPGSALIIRIAPCVVRMRRRGASQFGLVELTGGATVPVGSRMAARRRWVGFAPVRAIRVLSALQAGAARGIRRPEEKPTVLDANAANASCIECRAPPPGNSRRNPIIVRSSAGAEPAVGVNQRWAQQTGGVKRWSPGKQWSRESSEMGEKER